MNASRFRTCTVFSVIVIFALSIPCTAQVIKGSISGTVIDQQGSLISGARVEAREQSTGAVFTATSNDSGTFRLTLLPVGTYDVAIRSQGFETTENKGIAVSAGAGSNVGMVRMTIGQE